MKSNTVNLITGLIGFAALAAFIIGLAEGITSGFAGFWGGLPFWVISIFVLGLAFYNFWEMCVRKRD